MTFPCPEATTLPPPPTQPTSDSNETPPTTFQQPEELITVSPPTTNSLNDNNAQSETEPDSQVVTTTGVVSDVPSSSETATDGQISTSDANVGLIVGLAIAILVIMSLVIAMVTIAAVALKKCEKMKDLSSSRAISNIMYGTKGQSSIIIIMIANEINCTVTVSRRSKFCMIDLSLSIIYHFFNETII